MSRLALKSLKKGNDRRDAVLLLVQYGKGEAKIEIQRARMSFSFGGRFGEQRGDQSADDHDVIGQISKHRRNVKAR